MDAGRIATPALDQAGFWRLIEAARLASHGDIDLQMDRLREQLAAIPPEDIIRFDAILHELLARAYRGDVWAAAYIIQGGCSDDCFEYFRGWLIAHGEAVYSAALRDPESLADVASLVDQDNECETLLAVASDAYRAKTGQALPHQPVVQPDIGDTPFDEDTLSSRFPRLAARFGW